MLSSNKVVAVALAIGVVLSGCRQAPQAEGDVSRAMGEATEGVQGMPAMAPGMMQRHAEELDQMTTRMRQHLQEMRRLSPGEQHARLGEHAGQVSAMLNLMSRQMREMDMGMGMSDEQMGRMMGMSGEEHRRMTDEMQAIRAEAEQLQTATEAQIRQRMPAHLERLERMVPMLEQSAEQMRGS